MTRRKSAISITLRDELIELIDDLRGDDSRSHFIEEVLKYAFSDLLERRKNV